MIEGTKPILEMKTYLDRRKQLAPCLVTTQTKKRI